MFTKPNFVLLSLIVLSATPQVLGREQWLERDGRAIYFYRRRFGQDQPAVLQKIRDACPGAVCGTLAIQSVAPLLAGASECSQQNMADSIIDASKQFDAATAAAMVAAAVEYRQVEKNTPSDFTTNPRSLRNSVFCQQAPKNSELNGLVQAQDPANDPEFFFDPASKATVRKGSQANTAPFSGAANLLVEDSSQDGMSSHFVYGVLAPREPTAGDPTISATGKGATAIPTENPTSSACFTEITVTVTSTVSFTPTSAAATVTAPPAAPPPAGVDFGSCTVPEIEFGVGFDNRKETSFQPTDKKSFDHGSAQNIGIITQFMCDQLTNTCKANQAAKDLCATAKTAAAAAAAGTGAQADAFNAVFGISTDFASVAVVNNQGVVISPGTGAPSPGGAASPPAQPSPSSTPPPGTGGIGNFGKCSIPEIEFATGFDGRKETSFQPTDKTSFNHGSAQNINIITQFICDTLTNTCGADQTAKNTCATAKAAASAAPAGTGAQADAFNAGFGIKTNFASVQQINNQGVPVGGGAAASPAATLALASSPAPPTNSPSNGGGNTDTTGGNLQTFSGALGGVVAPTVTAAGGQFQVEGNASFKNLHDAVVRSCDVQNNQCANAANASGNQNGFTVSACIAQQAQCTAGA